MKVGFAKDGRITALDMFVVVNSGAYDAQGDAPSSGRIVSLLYQPPAMRWRGVTVMTNTPPRSAQSAPGGLQGIAITEPILAKAARKLGVDQVALRRVNCPAGKAEFGAPVKGKRAHTTSAFLKRSPGPRRGAVQVERKGGAPAQSGSAPRCAASAYRLAVMSAARSDSMG